MLIVIVNCFSKKRLPTPESVERTRMLYEFLVSKSKEAALFSVLPLMVKEALSVLPAPATSVYVNVSATS